MILNLDCRHGLAMLPDNSVSAIVTDPPYEIGMMGRAWDRSGIAHDVAMWREALRVLKPGGHILAFSGSRTYHRMAVAIEDAGFEIRDQIMWLYSTGFPKSHNVDNHAGSKICGCTLPYTHGTETIPECDLHALRNPNVSSPMDSGERGRKVLQSSVPKQSSPSAGWPELSAPEVRPGQSSMEGWSDSIQKAWELFGSSPREGAGVGQADGASGRLHNGTSVSDGGMVRATSDTGGMCTPLGSCAKQQPTGQFGTVAEQREPQVSGAWSICRGCGLPMVPKGLGTALKPAHEPICVGRKPLDSNTVIANLLAHGVGALNIDGCRIAVDFVADASQFRTMTVGQHDGATGWGMNTTKPGGERSVLKDKGRWPSNFIHSGIDSDWSRYFYCAKSSKKDRNEGLEAFDAVMTNFAAGTGLSKNGDGSPRNMNADAKNPHPTVKPTELMRYLCRLVTPPGGLIVDPFAGSGSTGKAAILEGFQFVGFELDPQYSAIANARLEAARNAA